MQRIAVLVFVVALSFGLLSGCGGVNFSGCSPGSLGGFSPMGLYLGGYCNWSF